MKITANIYIFVFIWWRYIASLFYIWHSFFCMIIIILTMVLNVREFEKKCSTVVAIYAPNTDLYIVLEEEKKASERETSERSIY